MSVVVLSQENPVIASNQLGGIWDYEAGGGNKPIAIFAFRWRSKNDSGGLSGLSRESHTEFNRLFSLSFPKQLNSYAFSTYSNSFFDRDWVEGTAETKSSDSATKARILELLKFVGLRNVNQGSFTFQYKTVAQIQAGAIVKLPTLNPTVPQQVSAANDKIPTWGELPGTLLDTLGASLGISAAVVGVAGIILLALLLRR